MVAVLMEAKLVGVLLAALFGSLAGGRLSFGFEDTELAVASAAPWSLALVPELRRGSPCATPARAGLAAPLGPGAGACAAMLCRGPERLLRY